jgi:hypothetical protein
MTHFTEEGLTPVPPEYNSVYMHTGDLPFDHGVDLTVLPTHLANCLRDVKARAIEIEGSHVAFTGGMFRLVSNWNVLVPFGYGDLTVDLTNRQIH